MPTIRPARPDDEPHLAPLRRALWPEVPADENRDELRVLLQNPEAGTAFVAVDDDGTLLGFVEASLRGTAEGCVTSPVGYVEGWYVRPEARHRGLGRALLGAAEGWAAACGCREMASDTEVANTVSQNAHGRCGYEPVGTLVHFTKLLMSSDETASESA